AQRGWLRPIPRREQNEIAERFIRQLGIRTPSAEQPIEFLSGGIDLSVGSVIAFTGVFLAKAIGFWGISPLVAFPLVLVMG
ncbi:hypothetical protein PXW85_27320, partial [Klebsiella pneumoniae]|nr:hypothetical protein [Klebsiella pneumoniae]